MISNIYVDFENVGSDGLTGLRGLQETDRVNILYSDKNNKLRIEEVEEIMQSPAEVTFIKAENGTKNALDFQLVALLFLEQKGASTKDEFVIISRDSGYDPAVRMGRIYGKNPICRISSIENLKTARKRMEEIRAAGADAARDSVNDEIPAEEEIEERVCTDPVVERVFEALEKTFCPAQEESFTQQEEPVPDSAVRDSREPSSVTPGHDTLPENAESEEDENRDQEDKSYLKNETDSAWPDMDSGEWGMEALVFGSAPAKMQKKGLKWKRIKRLMSEHAVYLDNDTAKLISSALNETTNKKCFYQFFQKKLGQKRGLEAYNKIKNYYGELVEV